MKVWLRPMDGGPPQEFEDSPEVLTPLMVARWRQCEGPEYAAVFAGSEKGGPILTDVALLRPRTTPAEFKKQSE